MRNHKVKKKSKWFLRNILLTLIILFGTSLVQDQKNSESIDSTAVIETVSAPKTVEALTLKSSAIEENKQLEKSIPDTIKSPNVILFDYETQEIMAEKASHETIYPASLTKLMTVLVALDYIPDLDKKIVMEEEYFEGLFEQQASISGFVEGEKVKMRDLLYGAMLPSGADACLALAHLIAGSEEAFVDLMNQKAEELGLQQTHYANVTGLHQSTNVSSVADISKIVMTGLENPVFYEVFTTLQYQVPPTNINEEGFVMKSTVFKNLMKSPGLMGTVIGGKTGFTEQAGLCMASLAVIDGHRYLLVTAGADAIPNFPVEQDRIVTKPYHMQDATAIYRRLTKEQSNVFNH